MASPLGLQSMRHRFQFAMSVWFCIVSVRMCASVLIQGLLCWATCMAFTAIAISQRGISAMLWAVLTLGSLNVGTERRVLCVLCTCQSGTLGFRRTCGEYYVLPVGSVPMPDV